MVTLNSVEQCTSLILALLRYKGIEVVLISPDELKPFLHNKDAMDDAALSGLETTSCKERSRTRRTYMTKQKYIFFNEEDYVTQGYLHIR